MKGWIPPHTWDPRCGDMITAVNLEINIQYFGFYGPPRPHKPEPKSTVSLGLKPEHKWGGKYETLTCMGKSWRSSI